MDSVLAESSERRRIRDADDRGGTTTHDSPKLIDGSGEDPGSKTLLSSFGVGDGLFAHPLSEGVL
ncbi:MAG: hypothetical protein Ct9H300mP12_02950 [Acidimicrobiales bacterium]|nr:MAG: hypothetical protein Ct9H300mP12_02950 [Acidimicrobiales bacterium]